MCARVSEIPMCDGLLMRASLLGQVYDLAYLVTILQEICLLLAK